MSNEFDDAVSSVLQPSMDGSSPLAQAARYGVAAAADTNPDAWAEAERVARRVGVPVTAVFTQPGLIKRQDTVGGIDFDALAQTSPTTAALLAEVDKARIAHDDVGNLSALEKALRTVWRGARSAAAGLGPDVSSGAYGLLETGFKVISPLADPLAGTLLPENPLRRVAAGFEGLRKNQEQFANAVAGDTKDAGFFEQGVLSGFRSFGQMAPGMAATIATGNPEFALGAAGALQGSQSTTKAMDAGVSPIRSLVYGAQDATAEIATEMLPVGRLLKDVQAGAPLFKVLAHQIATEVPTELAATAWQNFNEWANLHPDKPFKSYLDELPAAEGQTLIATVTTAMLTAGMGRGMHRIAAGQVAQAQQAQQAEQDAQHLQGLTDLAKASKVLQRDPETFQQFVEQAAQDGEVQDVYVDGRVFAQTLHDAGVDPTTLPQVVQDQLPVALAAGADVRIPVADYAARIAPTDWAGALADHLKVSPEAMSRAQARDWMQSGQASQLRDDINRTIEAQQGDTQFKDSQEAVKQQVLDQLTKLGRFDDRVNEPFAALIAAHAAVRAAQLGVMPTEYFDQRGGLKVSNKQVGGVQLDQPAYHGTPYRGIEKFSTDHIGTGEGAQAYGWGLYFAEKKHIAEWYRESLTERKYPSSFDYIKADDKWWYVFNFIKDVGVKEFAKNYLNNKLIYKSRDEAFDMLSARLDDVISHLYTRQHESMFESGAQPEMDENFDLVYGDEWNTTPEDLKDIEFIESQKKLIEEERKDFSFPPSDVNKVGQLYEVNVPEDSEMLLWDKPLTEQPEVVQKSAKLLKSDIEANWLEDKLGSMNAEWDELTGREYYNLIQKALIDDALIPNADSEADKAVITGQTDKAASLLLMDDGIKGIKYLDGSSRSAGTGSHNYVIFHGDDVAITRQFYQTQRGTFHPATNTISLLKDADLSTFLHESGHFFFESDINLAAVLVKSRREGAGLTEGEEEILRDVSALLAWHGIKGNIDEQLSEWYQLDFEGQRVAHERTAESFEKYLFEGKAPSLELQPYFQRFRAWLLNVYKSIRSFLDAHPEAGKLNADVRRVFDRMLATNEQIQLAEHGRSMAPLFATPEQAGMTPDEFARYHALGVQATQDAAQDLQARSLRDLRWIQNARGREINKLQRHVQGQRDEMTIEARREVMAQPVYQAWQFLTAEQRREDMSPAEVARADYQQAVAEWNEQRRAIATQAREQARKDLDNNMDLAFGEKENAIEAAVKSAVRRWIKSGNPKDNWIYVDGKARRVIQNGNPKPRPPDYRPKSDPNHVDPSQDSLLTAIAKLGGIDRESASQHLGVNKDDYRASSGVFGKPVFRKEGGASADGMAELLVSEGYLPADEHGRADLMDLEERLGQELGGNPQYSNRFDYSQLDEAPLYESAYPQALAAGRINDFALRDVLAGLPMMEPGTDLAERDQQTIVARLRERGMLAPGAEEGMHPDIVAELFGFGSGQELVSELAAATPPTEAITQLADQKMLQRYGELATPDAIASAADAAIHNEARARFVAAEFDALTKAVNHTEATGTTDKAGRPVQRRVLHSAAADYARKLIDRMKVRDVRPGQWAAAEARAARAADAAMRRGDMGTASAEKRNQLLNNLTAKSANQAQAEIDKSLDYLNKFNREGARAALAQDSVDQIDTLLERFDLRRGQSLRAIDKRKSLSEWLKSQEDRGLEPDIPEKLRNEALRQSWRDMTVSELRDLVDTVKQIEHLGRLKERLLTAQDERSFDAVVGEIIGSIREHGGEDRPENRTRDTLASKAKILFRGYMAEHRKVASLVYQLDGFKENGPLWSAFIRPMNDAGNREATMQAEAAEHLSKLLEPIRGKGFWQKTHFETLGQSLTRGEQIVIALNMGNVGNKQRLLDGYGWTMAQVQPVLDNLTAADWQFVQGVWDYYETFRPQIAAQEKRLYGKEPNWVEAEAVRAKTREGQELELRGGYYPVMYDPRATGEAQRYAGAEEAKAMMQGAFVASTTRSGHTKARAEAVMGRPVILTWDAMFRGFNDVIHRLSWQDWAIDQNRLLRDHDIDEAIRGKMGAEGVKQFTDLVRDIAAGDNQSVSALEKSLSYVRAGAAVAGLGFNIMNALLQPLGLTQSMVRIGPKWVAQGITAWAKSPVELVKQVHEKSEFMRNRARNSNRDVREVYARNMGMSRSMAWVNSAMFAPMMALQTVADMPTWWGAYQKAQADAPVGLDAELIERQAVGLADQAVIDAQGAGQTKDLANIQRGGGVKKLFTTFYGFFSTSYQLAVERGKATNYRDPLDVIKLANDYLLLLVAPAALGAILKQALQPGGDDDWDMENLLKKLAGEQISYLLNMLVGVRELTGAAQTLAGVKEFNTAYQGPAALRFFSEVDKIATQMNQGDFDAALRRSAVNVSGIALHLPSAQINRTLDGISAMQDGQTSNPAALAFGYNKQK